MIETSQQKVKYEYISHGPWVSLLKTGKTICAGCGLVHSNKPYTQWAIQKGCNYNDHPGAKQARHKYTRFFK